MSNKGSLDFLICYEHINREVENDALLKAELEKRGYSCEIINFYGPGYAKYAKEKAKVVCTPWLRYNENVYNYLQLAEKPYKLVNLQWEQVYSKAGLDSGLTSIGEQAKRAVHLCWGQNSRDRLLRYGVPEKNLFITGAIQQDYGRELFKNYYKSKEELAEEFGLNTSKRWILYVSSFAWTKYKDHDLEMYRKKFGDYIIENYRLHIDSQKATLDWIDKLLSEYDCEFIYRPHPSERANDSINRMSEKHSSFKVISDYSVKQWAKVSDVVNLWISTSNAEIASMGIPFHIVRPIPVPESLDVECMVSSDYVDNYDDFKSLNVSSSSDEFDSSAQLSALKKYYDYDSNRAAYERFADSLVSILKDDSYSAEYSFTLSEKIKFGNICMKKKKTMSIANKKMSGKNIGKSYPFLRKKIRDNIERRISMESTKDSVVNRVVEYVRNNEQKI